MKTRSTIPLDPLLDNELTSYVAAARGASTNHKFVAAAVSAITLASVSLVPDLHAEVVYTPANKSVGKSNGTSYLPIDLNNDGVVDLSVTAYNFISFSSGIHERADLDAFGLQGNQVLVEESYDAVPGLMGQRIGFAASARFGFRQDAVMAAFRHSTDGFSSFNTSEGLWLHATDRYLGVKFSINGETHYGWARFNAGAGYAQLTGYAYETIPDKPIRAGVLDTPLPESGANTEGSAGSLGALALGMAGR